MTRTVHRSSSVLLTLVRCRLKVRTSSGRGRAWIRFALIEKKLEKYMRMLIADRADITAKWYLTTTVTSSIN
jgi:hypothetical protein